MNKLLASLLIPVFAFACPGGDPAANCGDLPWYEPGRVYEVERSERVDNEARKLKTDLDKKWLNFRTYNGLDSIIKYAALRLKLAGNKTESQKLLKEWKNTYSLYFIKYNQKTGRPLGDHRPLSKWLADKTLILELILGVEVMKATRLYDLKVFNYAIEIVFSCVDNVDEFEFSLHFIPLMGVSGYWISMFACVGFTWGTGFLFCSPIALGVEYTVKNIVAPPFNNNVWEWSCLDKELK